MKKIHLVTIFLCFQVSWSLAQTTATLKGKVIDKISRQPLPNSNITIIGTNYGGAAADNGWFVIEHLPPGTYSVKASRIDYHPQVLTNIQLKAGQQKEILFELVPRVLEMAPIEVEADKFSLKYQTEVSRIGFQQINPRQIKRIPGALDDVARAIQIFGSVMPASDYNSYFAVRGGSPEQNLVIMDGVVIPNPYRFRLLLGGGLSIFDPNTTEDVRLHIGGFSAEFGNFLSSVLEVDTREGNRHRICARGSLNLIDASGVVEGPILNGRGSWLLAGRRTYYDLLANRFSKNNATYPNTSDINGKLVFNLTERNKLSLRTMMCQEGTRMLSEISDELNINEDSKIQLFSLDWLNTASRKLTYRTTLSYYLEDFNFKLDKPEEVGPLSIYASLNSDMITFSIREDVIYEFSETIWMTRGIYFSSMNSNVNFVMPQRTLAFARRDFPPPMKFKDQENYLAFYMDDIYKLKKFFHIKVGLRYDYSNLIKKSALSPRLGLWLQLSEHLGLEGFWGMCSQNPNVLSAFIRNRAIDLSSNLDKLEPERATHSTLGLSYKFTSTIHGKLEFYHKDLDQLLFAENKVDKRPANIGRGFSKGIEFYIQKEADEASVFSGIFSYSYGISRYKETINNVWLPMSFDRRHCLSFMGTIRLMPNLTANVLWRATSGLPYTSAYGLVLTEGGRNSFEKDETQRKYFPPYQRLDLRLNYEHRSGASTGGRGHKAFAMYIDLTNLYNHKNVYDQFWEISRLEEQIPSELRVVKMRTMYMLPLVPSFGLSFEF
ncbi:MAG: TonB-dependent receptor [candidate division KSB1 bacterium]|nr:TonB-dependent receptor [candidate division KSB1 bacterium]